MKLDAKILEDLGRKAIDVAISRVSSDDLNQIKLFATGYLLGLIEKFDNAIPIAGAFADLPFVDDAEEYLVGAVIDKLFNKMSLEDLAS